MLLSAKDLSKLYQIVHALLRGKKINKKKNKINEKDKIFAVSPSIVSS